MPLIHGKSQKTFVKNLKTELEAGKPMKQSLAIAYAMKKRKKMAEGSKDGPASNDKNSDQNHLKAADTFAKPKSDFTKNMADAFKAKGGEVKGVHGEMHKINP